MEKLVDQGLVKSIGVSNFNSQQIERLLANCRIEPVTNQVWRRLRILPSSSSSFLSSLLILDWSVTNRQSEEIDQVLQRARHHRNGLLSAGNVSLRLILWAMSAFVLTNLKKLSSLPFIENVEYSFLQCLFADRSSMEVSQNSSPMSSSRKSLRSITKALFNWLFVTRFVSSS